MKGKLTGILLILLVSISNLYAQSATSSFDVDGIKVIFKPIPKSIVNVQLYFRGGVSNYPANQAGIENLALGATVQCGTKKYDANTFKNIEDKYGLLLAGAGAYDYGVIKLNCITKYFNEGWDLFSEAVINPVFDTRQIDLIKDKLITQSNRKQDAPDAHLNQLLMQNAFKGTPYTTDPDGNEGTLRNLSSTDLGSYYNSILNRNQIFIVIVGDLTKDEIIQKIKASFSSIPSKPYTPVTYNEPVWSDNKVLAENRQIATNYISAVMQCPKETSPDYAPFRLGMSILSGQLFLHLRTKLDLSYAPGATVTNLLMPYSKMYVSTNDPVQAVREMVTTVRQLKSFMISDRSLVHLKNNYITSNYIKSESSGDIANALGESEVNGGWQNDENFVDQVTAVTAADINRVMIKYLTGLRWNYLGNKSLADAASDEFNMALKY